MPQAPEICAIPLHVCRFRVTRLNADGSIQYGPNNVYVSDNLISVQRNPNVEIGLESSLVGGCGCIVATRKDPDRLKRFDFQINQGALEPAMLEMMLGADLISDASDSPVPIGIWYPDQIGCTFTPVWVAIEFWADAWVGDSADPDWPYIHFLYPRTSWQEGTITSGNDFSPPVINGFTKSNALWGEGPYGDQPEAVPTGAPGGWWYDTTTPPAAECGYQTVATPA
jgi:hypothetical protein